MAQIEIESKYESLKDSIEKYTENRFVKNEHVLSKNAWDYSKYSFIIDMLENNDIKEDIITFINNNKEYYNKFITIDFNTSSSTSKIADDIVNDPYIFSDFLNTNNAAVSEGLITVFEDILSRKEIN